MQTTETPNAPGTFRVSAMANLLDQDFIDLTSDSADESQFSLPQESRPSQKFKNQMQQVDYRNQRKQRNPRPQRKHKPTKKRKIDTKETKETIEAKMETTKVTTMTTLESESVSNSQTPRMKGLNSDFVAVSAINLAFQSRVLLKSTILDYDPLIFSLQKTTVNDVLDVDVNDLHVLDSETKVIAPMHGKDEKKEDNISKQKTPSPAVTSSTSSTLSTLSTPSVPARVNLLQKLQQLHIHISHRGFHYQIDKHNMYQTDSCFIRRAQAVLSPSVLLSSTATASTIRCPVVIKFLTNKYNKHNESLGKIRHLTCQQQQSDHRQRQLGYNRHNQSEESKQYVVPMCYYDNVRMSRVYESLQKFYSSDENKSKQKNTTIESDSESEPEPEVEKFAFNSSSKNAQREIIALQRLQHPYIIKIHDWFAIGDVGVEAETGVEVEKINTDDSNNNNNNNNNNINATITMSSDDTDNTSSEEKNDNVNITSNISNINYNKHITEFFNSTAIVLEYAPYGDLLTYLTFISNKYNDAPNVLARIQHQLCEQLASAVEYAHSQNIVHCDIKPDNVLISWSGQVKLADWGLSVVLDEEGKKEAKERKETKEGKERKDIKSQPELAVKTTAKTTTKTTAKKVIKNAVPASHGRTSQYSSPERLRANSEAFDGDGGGGSSGISGSFDGKQADIWSLGLTFYAIFYCKTPFHSLEHELNNRNNFMSTNLWHKQRPQQRRLNRLNNNQNFNRDFKQESDLHQYNQTKARQVYKNYEFTDAYAYQHIFNNFFNNNNINRNSHNSHKKQYHHYYDLNTIDTIIIDIITNFPHRLLIKHACPLLPFLEKSNPFMCFLINSCLSSDVNQRPTARMICEWFKRQSMQPAV